MKKNTISYYLASLLICLNISLQAQTPEIILEIAQAQANNIQWYQYDETGTTFIPMVGETTQTLTTTEAGVFFATYSGPGCSSATIPAVVQNGSDGVLNEAVTLKAQSSDASASFQWVRNGVELPAATNDSLETDIAGRYGVVVSKNGCPADTQFIDVLALDKLFLSVRVLLQGAMIGVNDTLMRDDLRTTGMLPLNEPYSSSTSSRLMHTGSESTTQDILDNNAGTKDAIVDWVLLELRDTTNPSTIVETKAALVQRDGDVVDPTDGISAIDWSEHFGKTFFLAIKHRNHLGAMINTPLLMKGQKNMDFINTSFGDLFEQSAEYDSLEMVEISGKKALWAGDANADGLLKYQGSKKDLNIILQEVLTYEGDIPNTNLAYNFDHAFGYFGGDINMDGKLKYQGSNDDTQFLLQNVLVRYAKLNTKSLYNFALIREQLPQ